jgi:carbamoyltransferase
VVQYVVEVFVLRNLGDGGLPVGCALQVGVDTGRAAVAYAVRAMVRAVLGPLFDNDRIAAAIRARDLPQRRVTDPAEAAYLALQRGLVVGWFQGRMEYGPRALCHRSILFHSRDTTINDWLNKRLDRTEFMPFAPVTTAELAGQCFVGWSANDLSSRLMTMTYDCTAEFKADSPAVVHVDGTARPQVVHRQNDQLTHRLLTIWCERQHAMSLINTSFNHHEEPIVCTPEDALESMLKGNVDVLVAGNLVTATAPIWGQLERG